ncbi:MAG TPA: twin-arginine translocase TatA/TatE family subunit [Rhodanobacter sp.]|jgi:sec-independent protein translocase protein TatA|nr:twin-arginine translocase TatA/TatE family subunit [Rhodanobacter sp.]
MSIWHLVILLVVVVVVFGTGRLAKIGPDLGAAIRGFKKSMSGDDVDATAPKPAAPEVLSADPPAAASTAQQTQHDTTQSK